MPKSRPLAGYYYNRDGRPITLEAWSALLADPTYQRVALTRVDDDVEVSTVWLGLNHRFIGEGPPLIFETLVFGGPLDGHMDRYPNEVAALAGHDQMVAECRGVHAES